MAEQTQPRGNMKAPAHSSLVPAPKAAPKTRALAVVLASVVAASQVRCANDAPQLHSGQDVQQIPIPTADTGLVPADTGNGTPVADTGVATDATVNADARDVGVVHVARCNPMQRPVTLDMTTGHAQDLVTRTYRVGDTQAYTVGSRGDEPLRFIAFSNMQTVLGDDGYLTARVQVSDRNASCEQESEVGSGTRRAPPQVAVVQAGVRYNVTVRIVGAQHDQNAGPDEGWQVQATLSADRVGPVDAGPSD